MYVLYVRVLKYDENKNFQAHKKHKSDTRSRVLRKDISIVSTKTQNVQKYCASGIRGWAERTLRGKLNKWF